jgi:hypothetical protein
MPTEVHGCCPSCLLDVFLPRPRCLSPFLKSRVRLPLAFRYQHLSSLKTCQFPPLQRLVSYIHAALPFIWVILRSTTSTFATVPSAWRPLPHDATTCQCAGSRSRRIVRFWVQLPTTTVILPWSRTLTPRYLDSILGRPRVDANPRTFGPDSNARIAAELYLLGCS